MQFWKIFLEFMLKKKDLSMSPRERHNKDEICLKLSYEKIFVVFFHTDKSTELRKCSSIQIQLWT